MTGASISARVGRLEARQAHREATCFSALTATKEQPAMPDPTEDFTFPEVARRLARLVLSGACGEDAPHIALSDYGTPRQLTIGDLARRLAAEPVEPVDITRATIRFRCARHGCALSPATGSRPDSDLFEIRDEAGHAHGPASFSLDLTAALFCPTQFHEHDQRPDGTGGMGDACSADWTVTAENPS